MVAVTVGVDDGYDFKVIFFRLGHNPIGIRTGVDHQGLPGVFAANDIAKIVHVSDSDLFDDHHIPSSEPI
jgi:hypothetical protein